MSYCSNYHPAVLRSVRINHLLRELPGVNVFQQSKWIIGYVSSRGWWLCRHLFIWL